MEILQRLPDPEGDAGRLECQDPSVFGECVTDEIPALVRRLIESGDIDEVRRLRQQLNALIRARMDELRDKAARMTSEIRKREAASKKQRA